MHARAFSNSNGFAICTGIASFRQYAIDTRAQSKCRARLSSLAFSRLFRESHVLGNKISDIEFRGRLQSQFPSFRVSDNVLNSPAKELRDFIITNVFNITLILIVQFCLSMKKIVRDLKSFYDNVLLKASEKKQSINIFWC